MPELLDRPEAQPELPDNSLVNLVKDLLNDSNGRELLVKHGFTGSTPIAPHMIDVAEIIAVLKLICDGADIACPVVQSLP